MLKKDPTILRLLKLSPVAMESIPVFPALSSPTLEETGGIGVAFARNGANETVTSGFGLSKEMAALSFRSFQP